MKEIVLDIETTGLEFKHGDKIIEIACIELINHIATENCLQFYCSTKKTITEGARKVHGLSNIFLDEFSTFAEQTEKFLEFIKTSKIFSTLSFEVIILKYEKTKTHL